jgi:predicted metal-dependent phosphoesterase TrpH
VLDRVARESYVEPFELYETLKRRGMDLVTVTDHDSIDASETLRRFQDFFTSVEVTAVMPSGTQIHIGVYDVTERQHIEIQRRRNDLLSLVAYLSEKRLFFSLNHAFSSLTGPRDAADFEWFAQLFPAMETQNGHMLSLSNRCAARFASLYGIAAIGGSDAHALPSAAATWTEVRGARTKREFLSALARGQGRVRGESGGYRKLTRDVFHIVAAVLKEHPWLLPMAPAVAAIVPVWTLTNWWNELQFVTKWGAEFGAWREVRHLPRIVSLPEVAA